MGVGRGQKETLEDTKAVGRLAGNRKELDRDLEEGDRDERGRQVNLMNMYENVKETHCCA